MRADRRRGRDHRTVHEMGSACPSSAAATCAGRARLHYSDGTIRIVKGDKDVDRLRGLELSATCTMGDAGK